MSDEAAGEGRMPAPAEGPDAVVEYYKQFLDESLLRESGKLTPEQRLEKFFSFMELVGEVQRAGAAAGSSRSVGRRTPGRSDVTHRPADFRRLLGALAEGGVEFILVGGLAAVAHGAPRAT